MSAEPVPPLLRLVDQNGEVHEHRCPNCAELDDQLAGAERELRAWRTRYANLARDKEAEARESPLWPDAMKVFEYWRHVCKHPRAAWTADRFEVVAPYLKKDGVQMVMRAIDGAAFDPFLSKRRNGTVKRHDDFGLVFRDRDHFENFVNKAPLNV